MKILALSPFAPSTLSGNVVSLRRIQGEMRRRGHAFEIFEVLPTTTAADVPAADLLHFYHAYKTGRLLPSLAHRPSIVTISGTDLNHDFDDPSRRPDIEAALRSTGCIVTYNASLANRLRSVLPEVDSKIEVIPKGVTLGDRPYDIRGDAGLDASHFVFFHPGGIRPVKNNLFAVDALPPDARLVFAGPILDDEYGREFSDRIRNLERVRHIPHIPFDSMAAAYRAVDVVINTSVSEGLSNAIIEAMTCGRPVLAADIPGNRDLIRDGTTGLLYRDRNEFITQSRRLAGDAALRRCLGDAARIFASRTFSTEREAEALLRAYVSTSNRCSLPPGRR